MERYEVCLAWEGGVSKLALSTSLILTAEFIRRCWHVVHETYKSCKTNSFNHRTSTNDTSLPRRLQSWVDNTFNSWIDRKFVFIWLVVLAVTIWRYGLPNILPIALPYFLFVCMYVLLHDALMLSPSFIDKELTDGTNHIGPGLAVAWVSFIENVLLDKYQKDADCVKEYKNSQSIGSGQGVSEIYTTGHFITDRPVILFPDLASYIQNYEELLEAKSGKWCSALTTGIVEIDQMQRKKKGERELLFSVPQNMSYSYEVSGTTRYCEFRVIRWQDHRPSPNSPTMKYLRVIDNRPLDSIRKWYHDQKDHGVTIEELKNQCDIFLETLRTKLNEDERLRNKSYILPFSGILSQELIGFEKLVRANEKMPP